MYRIGIDLGGTNIKAGIVSENGKIIAKDSIKTFNRRDATEIIKDMGILAKKIIEDNNISQDEVISIGVGSPGTPDKKNGILIYTNNLPFNNVDIRKGIKQIIDKPVYLDNDANCAALAEAVAGACKGTDYSITITLGTGVGAGAVIDGKLYSGYNYGAPEIGHMVIVVDGEQCTCGRKGCFEQYSSATALIRETIKAAEENENSLINEMIDGDYTKVSAKTAYDAMRQGDETAKKVVDEYVRVLSIGLVNVINIFQPEIIALGGGVSNEKENLLKPLRPLIKKGIYTKNLEKNTKIVIASAGNDAGIIGAAMLDE